jgi:DNA-binding response OmpR family regulator
MRAKILLLEDDLSLGETLTKRLDKNGFAINWVKSLKEAHQFLNLHKYDLLIFDLGLPDGKAFDLVPQITSKSPLIFLTALNDVENRLKGYELGAVDYIPKPFHLKELLIRINNALPEHFNNESWNFGEIIVNNKAMQIERDGQKFPLTKKDYDVLSILIEKSPEVVSRDEILDQVWGTKYPSNRTIDNIILRLRQLLGEQGTELIRSIRGVGYQWTKKIGSEK